MLRAIDRLLYLYAEMSEDALYRLGVNAKSPGKSSTHFVLPAGKVLGYEIDNERRLWFASHT